MTNTTTGPTPKVAEAIATALSLGFVRISDNNRYVRCWAEKDGMECRSCVIVAAPYYDAQVRAHASWHARGHGFAPPREDAA